MCLCSVSRCSSVRGASRGPCPGPRYPPAGWGRSRPGPAAHSRAGRGGAARGRCERGRRRSGPGLEVSAGRRLRAANRTEPNRGRSAGSGRGTGAEGAGAEGAGAALPASGAPGRWLGPACAAALPPLPAVRPRPAALVWEPGRGTERGLRAALCQPPDEAPARGLPGPGERLPRGLGERLRGGCRTSGLGSFAPALPGCECEGSRAPAQPVL